MRSLALLRTALFLAFSFLGLRAQDPAVPVPAAPVISIERLTRTEPVDFDRDLLPVLQVSCLPCHNKTTTKADLLLETPADLIRGGESGAAVVPGNSAESLLLKLSTHEAKPSMPPKDNKANAVNLTPRELGLLALWIDQGCKASERRATQIHWESPAERVQPVYAVAMAADGHVAAAGRGNRLMLLDPVEGVVRGWLSDAGQSTNPAAAHRDLVNSVAFSPDGTWLASGGFREIKLWKRSFAPVGAWAEGTLPTNGFPGQPLAAPAGGRQLRLNTNGVPELADDKGNPIVGLHAGPRLPESDAPRIRRLAQSDLDAHRSRLASVEKELAAQSDRVRKSAEALEVARKARDEKASLEHRARVVSSIAEAVLARGERAGSSTNELKVLRDRLEAARKAVEPLAAEALKTQTRLDTAGEESRLAQWSRDRAAVSLLVARRSLDDAHAKLDALPGGTNPIPWIEVRTAAWSPSGHRVALVTARTVQVWSAETGVWIASSVLGEDVDRLSFEGETRLRLGRSCSPGVASWDFESRYVLSATLGSGEDNSPLPDRVNALAFRPDGLRLASGSGEPTRGGEVRVWDPATGRHLYGFTNVHSDAVLALAWSPDGSRLATGGADRFARVIDVADGRIVASLEGHTGHVLAVSWRADGRVLATGSADLAVKFWTLGSADRAKTVTGFGKEIVAVCHLGTGGDVVAVPGEADFVRVTEAGEKPSTLPGSREFQHAAAVSYDGRWLLAGGQDGVLRSWDIETRKVRRELGR